MDNKKSQYITKTNSTYWMGIATIFILFLHLGQNDSPHFLHKLILYIFNDVNIGVNIFFFLSAYGCCHSWRLNKPKNFYINRFKRLYPMMLAFMISSYFVNATFNINTFIFDMICHASGISLFYNAHFHDWFTPAIVLMYISFPLLFKAIKSIYNLRGGDYLIALSAIVPSLLLVFLQPFVYELVFPRIGMVISAIAVFLAEQDNQKRKIAKIVVLYFFISITSIVRNSYLIVPCIILFASKYNIRPFGEKWISFLGKHSLEIYLAQCLWVFEFDYESGNYVYTLCESLLIMSITAFVIWAIQHYSWKLFANL